MNRLILGCVFALGISGTGQVYAGFEQALSQYQAAGAGNFSADRGRSMWTQSHAAQDGGKSRSCTSCHTDNLKSDGKHIKTGKHIDPLAPSVNAERLTDLKKIEKWFKRNCKWTLGRECTAQEKGDFLTYIKTQ